MVDSRVRWRSAAHPAAAVALVAACLPLHGCFLYPFHETALAYEDAIELPGARAFAHWPRLIAVGNDSTIRIVDVDFDLGIHATDIQVPGGATSLQFRALHPNFAQSGMLGLVIRNADHLAITRSVTYPVSFGALDPIESGVTVSRPDLRDMTGDTLPELVYARHDAPGESTLVVRANDDGFFPFGVASPGPPGTVNSVVILNDGPQQPIIALATADYVFAMRGDASLAFQFINQTTGASQPSPLGAAVDLGRRITGLAFLETDVEGFALTASLADPPGIATLRRRPDGTFEPPMFYGFGADAARTGAQVDEAIDPVIADFDRDGALDVAVARPSTNTLGVWRGGPSGLIEPPTLLPVEAGCVSLVVADVNLDFWPDLCVSHPVPGAARAIFNDRAGGFVARTPKALTSMPSSIISGDFDGNGAQDVLMPLLATLFALHAGDTHTPEDVAATPIMLPNPSAAARRPLRVRPASALADRDQFAALLRSAGGKIVIHRVQGAIPALTAQVVQSIEFGPTETPWDYDVADIDADGDSDLAVLVLSHLSLAYRIELFTQSETGQFQPLTQFPVGGPPGAVRLGNFVAGALADVLTVQANPSLARVYRSEGGAVYTALPPRNIFGGNQIDALVVADIGDDGDDDFLYASTALSLPPFEASRIRAWLGDGSGAFGEGVLLLLHGPVASMEVGDVNADGLPDLAAYVRDSASTDALTCWDLLLLPVSPCAPCAQAPPTAMHVSCRSNAAGPHPVVTLVTASLSPDAPDAAARPWIAFTDSDGAVHQLRTRPNLGALHAPCPGDFDADRDVDFLDLNRVLSDFGRSGLFGTIPGDADLDGDCDFIDLNIVLSAFGTTC